MKVKICGITNIEDALISADLGADALGFIFYNKSKRFIEYNNAVEIISLLPEGIKKIGVFVNAGHELINKVSAETGLTEVQLHGDETQEEIDKILLPVWKAFRVNEEFDFNILKEYTNCSYMLDTYSENEVGGTGKSFNWNIIPHEIRNNIILAGGITAAKIEEIYKNISPAWIDVSSSLESYPGKKDKTKLTEFFNSINKLRNG
ncbi:MAG: phosphoribosylanthranilate isomerase [Bacteroidetes bacterium]|nr:phosphoribosylanthranilate isomerase [Bacteroidota bacterium]